MKTLGERIRWARKRKGLTQDDVAAHFSLTRNAVSIWESDKSVPAKDRIAQLAKLFSVNVEWLWSGRGSPHQAEIKIVGYVGAGGAITPIDDHAKGAGLDEVVVPFSEFHNLVAVIVRGDSMYPAYHDGDRLLYTLEAGTEPGQWLNRECVVKLTNGIMYVKIVKRGHNGLWTLKSHNAPDIEDADLEWAAPVRWVQRANL